jgi:hypothetical protein
MLPVTVPHMSLFFTASNPTVFKRLHGRAILTPIAPTLVDLVATTLCGWTVLVAKAPIGLDDLEVPVYDADTHRHLVEQVRLEPGVDILHVTPRRHLGA